MLTKGYPLELKGELAEAAEVCEAAVEAARLSGNRHYLFWALFELAWPRYFAGDLEAAIEACEESLDLRRAADRRRRSRPPAAAPAGRSAVALLDLRRDRARRCEAMQALGSEEIEFAVPVERCFDWETFALAELEAGNVEVAEAHAARAEELAAGLDGLRLPAALAGRTRAAILLHKGEGEAAVAPARAGVDGCARAPAPGCRPPSRGSCSAGRSPPPASAEEAIAELREAERELDALRLAARARRGPARAAQARRPPRGAGAGGGRDRGRVADQARARDRRPRHRPPHQQGDRRRALPQREDDRVPPAEHLLQARRLLPRRRRPGGRA